MKVRFISPSTSVASGHRARPSIVCVFSRVFVAVKERVAPARQYRMNWLATIVVCTVGKTRHLS